MVFDKRIIEQGKTKFLVKTDCSFLIQNFLYGIKSVLIDYDFIECNDLEKFIDTINEQNLFSDNKRIITLNNFDPDYVNAVGAIIEQPTDDVWILLQKDTLPRNKAVTRIKGVCNFVEFKDLNEDQCAVWVRQWLKDIGLIYSEDIPSYIVSRVGTNISKIQNEIKKLSFLYGGDRDKLVVKSDCDKIFSENKESKFFVIVEDFFKKRLKDVLEEFKKIDEYSYVKLLHLFIGQTEKLYKIAVYKEQGMSLNDISQMIGVPKFIVKTKLFTSLSFYNKIKLMKLLDLFNELDVQIRLTKYPKNLVFESYLIKAVKI